MNASKRVERLLRQHEIEDYRWFDPQRVVTAQWVRMKCIFGCQEYGKNACCPPNTPPVEECARFFSEYRSMVIMHMQKNVERPEDRHAWTQEVNRSLLDLERDLFLGGYHKAFLLFMDSCGFCDPCGKRRISCKEQRMARPAPEAMAVDVFATVRRAGFQIEVLNDYAQQMNRYAFLMVE